MPVTALVMVCSNSPPQDGFTVNQVFAIKV